MAYKNRQDAIDYHKSYWENNKESESARIKAWKLKNKDKLKQQAKEYREANKDKESQKKKEYYLKNKDSILARNKTYREANKEKVAAQINKWKANNAGHVSARMRKYQTKKMNRTPKWLTIDDFWIIKEIYDLAIKRTKLHGFSWHVDHIIPLQGKLVSGLHVPNNLRVIPAIENIKKQNKFEVV